MDCAEVCRICLITDVKMYDLRLHPLDHYTKSIDVFETSKDLPPYACFECAAMIKNTYLFTEKCVRGQTALCNMIDSVRQITERNVQQINRFDLNLVSSLSCHSISADSIITVKYEELDTPAVKVELYNEDVSDDETKAFLELEVNTDVKHEDSGDENDEISFSSNSYNQQDLEPKTLGKGKKPKLPLQKVKKLKALLSKELKPQKSKNPPRKALRKCAPRKTTNEKAKGLADSAACGAEENFNMEENVNIIVLSKKEQLEEIEKRKSSSNYLKSAFKCSLCYKGFLDEAAWRHHRSRHDPEAGDIECEICKFRFKYKWQLTNHAKIHTTRYACKTCPYVSSASAQAKRHHQWHRGVTYQCKHCGEVVATSTAYFSHVRLKHPSEFVCGECGHSFVSHRGLALHKSLAHKGADKCKVSGDEGKHCAECDVKFATPEAYQRHLETSAKHNQIQQSNRIELVSEEALEAQRTRRRQLRARARGDSKAPARAFPAPCDLCPEVVESPRAYWAHFRRAHPGQEYPMRWNHVCEVCGKSFKSMSFLRYHARTHTSQRPYQCPRCPKAFHNPNKLTVHKRSHSDARPHACTLCDKTYKSRNALVKHMQYSAQHGGLRPHKCELCDKAFSESSNLRVHVRTVHLKQPYPKRVRKRQKELPLLQSTSIVG